MKKVLSLLLAMMILASAILLVSCGKDEKKQNSSDEHQNSIGDNQNPVESKKQIPVYQGMTITSIQSTSALSYANNKDEDGKDGFDYDKDNGNHNGHFKGDHTGKDEEIDEENPYPDNNENENIEEEIKSSLNVIGSPDEIYYATPNEDIYINIHIDNPDSFEIMSFTLNGKKYSSYMFEDGSDMETIVLKYNVGSSVGIVEYTIDAIKYVDGTEIKDVLIDGNKTVMAGIKTENQVVANVTGVDIGTNDISFNVNIKDNDSLIAFSDGALKAVLYDGFSIVSEKDLALGSNDITFDNLKINTLYQYAIIGYYDDLAGSGFGMNLLYKDAFYTDSVVLFHNIVIGQEDISFGFLWHENHQGKSLSALKLYKGEMFLKDLTANVTTVNDLLSNTTYKLVAEYINADKTETIYLEFTTLAKATPEISVISPTKTQTSVGFEISETDTDNVGAITKIELVHANGTVVADSLDVRSFTGLLSNNTYTVKVTYLYNLHDGEGSHTVTKELAITTEAKTTPSFVIKNEEINTDIINAEYDVTDVDNVLASYKVELYKDDTLVEENAEKNITFTSLSYYTDYTVRITFTYDLNDGNGVQTSTAEKTYKTLPFIDVIKCDVANTSAVSEGETIFMSVNLNNPLNMSIESAVINGVTYGVTGASTSNKIFVEIIYNGQFAGGDTHLKIDKVNAKLDGNNYTVIPDTELSDNVFINGKVEVVKIEFVNSELDPLENWVFPSEEVYILITLNNPTGYVIDNFSDYTKLDDNQYYYKKSSWSGWSSSHSISSLTYHNEYISKSITLNTVFVSNPLYCVASDEVKYISTPDDLKKMSDAYYYELTNDIDLTGLEWHCEKFNGVFDGKNYSIKNMSYIGTVTDSTSYFGLFGEGNGIIKDLNIEEATIIAEGTNLNGLYCGGLVAFSRNLRIIGCTTDKYSIFNIRNTHGPSYVGGFVGMAYGSNKITNSTNNSNISVISEGSHEFEQCSAYVGGLVGWGYYVAIYNCTNNGSISANSEYDLAYAGGMIGITVLENCTVKNSINNGNINTNSDTYGIGGIVGLSDYGTITIVNCISTGELTGSHKDSFIGCNLYDNTIVTIINSYSTVSDNVSSSGKLCTVEQLNDKAFYTETLGWSEDVWDLSDLDIENGKYPELKQ